MLQRLNSLGFRLFVSYFIPLALFLAVALVAFITIQRLLGALVREQRTQEVLTKVYELKNGLSQMAAAKRAHHLLGDESLQAQFEQRRQYALADLEALRQLLREDPGQQAELQTLADLEYQWYQMANADFKLFQGQPPQPDESWHKLLTQLHLRGAVALLDQIDDKTEKILIAEQTRLQERRELVRRTTRESIWTIGLGIALALTLSFAVTVTSARSVTKPILQLRNASQDLRHGQFSVVPPAGPGEIAELIRGFNLTGIALVEQTTLLQTSEHRYRTIVGTTSTLLWTSDAQGQNLDLVRWCAFTGQSEDEAKDDGWLQAVHPDDRASFQDRHAQSLAQQSYTEDEIRVRRSDGCYRHFLFRTIPILDEQGTVVEWVHICTDITERKEEESLRREKEAAEAANRAKSDFLAKMSHELRTPLNAVIGMSNMLQTRRFGPLTAKQADYLGDIVQSGEHLLRLINDILDLSKVEAGRLELTLESVSLGSTVTSVLTTVRPLLEAKNLRVDCDLPATDAALTTDPARLKQVLFNLLSNAVKYTPSGGRVSVRASWMDAVSPRGQAVPAHAAQGVRIEVEDTGVGIDPKYQGLLGTDFYQVKQSPQHAAEGTGLGLALTRRLVGLMGGAFWFRSVPGQGSCFTLVLPLDPSPATNGNPEARNVPMPLSAS